jgi:hypothetical protein
MNPKKTYTYDGKTFERSGEKRIPQKGDYYLLGGVSPLLCVRSHDYDSVAQPILREIGTTSTVGDGLSRVQGEVVATPPLRRIDVESPRGHETPSATVGFSRKLDGKARVRLELTERFVSHSGIQKHKDRNVVAPKMLPEVARRIGKALIEAADAAESGNYQFSKRS